MLLLLSNGRIYLKLVPLLEFISPAICHEFLELSQRISNESHMIGAAAAAATAGSKKEKGIHSANIESTINDKYSTLFSNHR